MRHNSILQIAFIALCLPCLVLAKTAPVDPFFNYRDLSNKPLTIEQKDLNHFQEAEKLIREKLALNLSQRERSILSGLHWLITFADVDDHFKFMFSDFLLLMNVLANSEDRIHQRDVVDLITKTSLARAQNHLNEYYLPEENSRWAFICILQALSRHKEFEPAYFKFYREFFKPIDRVVDNDSRKKFSHAIQVADYKTIFDHLVGLSFLHYYLAKEKRLAREMPKDDLKHFLNDFEKFRYITDHPVYTPQFRGLGYLVTHVVLVLTNYGEFDVPQGRVKDAAEAYIEDSLERIKILGDFDLYAEYIQCIKLLSKGRDKRIPALEAFIYGMQRSDGSWGSKRDFATSPYTGIHPTGAALMALNQSNTEEITLIPR